MLFNNINLEIKILINQTVKNNIVIQTQAKNLVSSLFKRVDPSASDFRITHKGKLKKI
jgi:hypothetical protein